MKSRIACISVMFALIVASSMTMGPTRHLQGQGIDDLQAAGEPALSNPDILNQLTVELREYDLQLQAVLKTRFPEEKAFVDAVVLEIYQGKLPKNVVDSAWLWVRQKRPGTPYPFVYFERVLRLEAERLNLKIPPFNSEIYTRGSQARTPEIREALRR